MPKEIYKKNIKKLDKKLDEQDKKMFKVVKLDQKKRDELKELKQRKQIYELGLSNKNYQWDKTLLGTRTNAKKLVKELKTEIKKTENLIKELGHKKYDISRKNIKLVMKKNSNKNKLIKAERRGLL